MTEVRKTYETNKTGGVTAVFSVVGDNSPNPAGGVVLEFHGKKRHSTASALPRESRRNLGLSPQK